MLTPTVTSLIGGLVAATAVGSISWCTLGGSTAKCSLIGRLVPRISPPSIIQSIPESSNCWSQAILPRVKKNKSIPSQVYLLRKAARSTMSKDGSAPEYRYFKFKEDVEASSSAAAQRKGWYCFLNVGCNFAIAGRQPKVDKMRRLCHLKELTCKLSCNIKL